MHVEQIAGQTRGNYCVNFQICEIYAAVCAFSAQHVWIKTCTALPSHSLCRFHFTRRFFHSRFFRVLFYFNCHIFFSFLSQPVGTTTTTKYVLFYCLILVRAEINEKRNVTRPATPFFLPLKQAER